MEALHIIGGWDSLTEVQRHHNISSEPYQGRSWENINHMLNELYKTGWYTATMVSHTTTDGRGDRESHGLYHIIMHRSRR
tara:strand:+ start:878 stop:1117 length:240 start_codon:yes stop_codon:yes gene_type:complete